MRVRTSKDKKIHEPSGLLRILFWSTSKKSVALDPARFKRFVSVFERVGAPSLQQKAPQR